MPTSAFNTLCRTRFGRMLVNRNDRYVGRSLCVYGEYSWAEMELFAQWLKPGDCVLEAGANIGSHTVPLAQRVGPEGRVWAFEPQRLVFQTLCANAALNHCTNIHALPLALGNHEGQVPVPACDPTQPNNFGGISLGDGAETVPLTTIDSLNLPACQLLKIDVEGMETAVLNGARDTVSRLRPPLYVENDRAEQAPALIALIRSLGYRLWWHCPPLFRPGNFNGVAEDIFGNIVSRNMLCLPEEHPAQMQGFEPVV